jgi:putative component of toxin-antitoxin plasmid stabilization module
MWYTEDGEATRSGFRKVSKNHPEEYASCFGNLEKILAILRNGNKVGGFKVGFFRSEGDGLYRIGQSGVKDSKEVRLYVYPDQESEIIYILAMGTKESQQADIKESKKKIKKLKGVKRENN